MSSSFPDFFLLGAGKAGTTTLADALAAHPRVTLSTPKEPCYFDGPDHTLGVDTYRERYFPDLRPGQITGEASSSHLFVPFVPERLFRVAPDTTLIGVLRHPVDRAFSHWWMFHCFGTEPRSFEQAIEENLARLADGRDLGGPGGVEAWYAERRSARVILPVYVDYGHYAEHIDRYVRYFPSRRLHWLLTGDLKDDLSGVVARLLRALDADPEEGGPPDPLRGERYNSRLVFRVTNAVLRSRVQYLVPRSTRRWISHRLRRLGNPPAMARAVRERLLEHYSLHNRRLERVLGRSLPSWDE